MKTALQKFGSSKNVKRKKIREIKKQNIFFKDGCIINENHDKSKTNLSIQKHNKQIIYSCFSL